MPGTDRFSHDDGRQRRALQRLTTGLYVWGPGLIFDQDSQTLSVEIAPDAGLEFVGNGLAVEAGLGIFLDASGVNVDILTAGGLMFTGNELGVDPGDGIELTAGGVAVNLLTLGGLEFTGGELNIADTIDLLTVGVSSVITFAGTANGAGILMATVAFGGRGPTAGTNSDAIFCEASRKTTPAVRQTTAGLTTIAAASGQVIRILTAGSAGTIIGLNSGTVALTGASSTILGGADGFSTRTASGISSFIQGHAALAGVLTASGFASHVIGYAASSGQHLASGVGSFCGGVQATSGANSADGTGAFTWGTNNNNDASYGFAFGNNCLTSTAAPYSIAHGHFASARHTGSLTEASSRFTDTGDGQRISLSAYARTTNATPAAMRVDNAAQAITLQDNSTATFEILIAAKEEAAGGERAAYRIEGAIGRDAGVGTVAILGAPVVTVLFETTAALDANVSADVTNGALQIDVTGLAATNIRWHAAIRISEVVGD